LCYRRKTHESAGGEKIAASESTDSVFVLIRSLIKECKFDAAERLVKEQLSIDAEIEALWILLIQIYHSQTNTAKEIETWLAATDHFPLWPKPWLELEILYRNRQDIDMAEKARREGIRLLKKQWL